MAYTYYFPRHSLSKKKYQKKMVASLLIIVSSLVQGPC